MRNRVDTCITPTTDSQIKFEENKRKVIFWNPERKPYQKVLVDACTIKDGIRCDGLLLSGDEHEERYIELKGTDVMHAIDQLEATIVRLGEFEGNRHSYVISTNVAPACTTKIQNRKFRFKKEYNSDLVVREKRHDVDLY